VLLVFGLGWLGGTSPGIAAEILHLDYEVKAAHLANLSKYVDWPATAFATTNSPVVIAVLGETKVTDELEKIIVDRIVNGRPIVLKQFAAGDDSSGCHILFVAAAEPRLTPNLLAKLKERSVLTVGESADFLERGGIISMTRRDQKIALAINLPAADQARIKISSKLLSVARVVKGKSN